MTNHISPRKSSSTDGLPSKQQPAAIEFEPRQYQDAAEAYVAAQLSNGLPPGILIHPWNTPQEWGAWKGYFLSRGIAHKHFDNVEQSVHGECDEEDYTFDTCFMVPRKFPSELDTHWDWADDERAGSRWMDIIHELKTKPKPSFAERGETIKWVKSQI